MRSMLELSTTSAPRFPPFLTAGDALSPSLSSYNEYQEKITMMTLEFLTFEPTISHRPAPRRHSRTRKKSFVIRDVSFDHPKRFKINLPKLRDPV